MIVSSNQYIQNLMSYHSATYFCGKTDCIPTERILGLISSGKTVREIKSELGLATDTYYKLLRERGISYNRKKPSDKLARITKNQIEVLLQQGLTVPEICKVLKIKANMYYSLVEQFGIKNPKKILSEKVAAITEVHLRERIESGLSPKDICQEYGISLSTYYDLLKKFNIETAYKAKVSHNSSIKKEQLVELLDAGKSMKEIMQILSISESSYISLISKFGIVTNAKAAVRNIEAITKDVLSSLVECGQSVKNICETLNISERTYSRLLDKFGIVTSRKKSKEVIASITKDELQSLVDRRLSPNDIADELGINVSMFYHLLKRLKINYDYAHHHGEIHIPKPKLIEFTTSGKTTKEISEGLGISVNTFHEKTKVAHVDTVLRPSIDKISSISSQTVQSLIDKGLSVKEICARLDITEAQYSALIRKHNLSTAHRQYRLNISSISKEQLLELRRQGKSVNEICSELQISRSTYRRLMNAGSEA